MAHEVGHNIGSQVFKHSFKVHIALVYFSLSNILPSLQTHPNLTPCCLSTALSLQNENTTVQEIPSRFILFPCLPPLSTSQLRTPSTTAIQLPDILGLDS